MTLIHRIKHFALGVCSLIFVSIGAQEASAQPSSAIQSQMTAFGIMQADMARMDAIDDAMIRDMQTMMKRTQTLPIDHLNDATSLPSQQNIRPHQFGYWRSVIIRNNKGKEETCQQQANFKGNGQKFSIVNAQASGNSDHCFSLNKEAWGSGVQHMEHRDNKNEDITITPVVDVKPAKTSGRKETL